MNVAVILSDVGFASALKAVLRDREHQLVPETHATLVITDRATGQEGATLLLSDDPAASPHEAEASLRVAIRDRCLARWGRPINVPLLLEVLAPMRADESYQDGSSSAPAPDLSAAPHPWLAIDAALGTIRNANDHAMDLLDLGTRGELPKSMARAGLPEDLIRGLHRHREGTLTVAWDLPYRYAAWWTDVGGRRVLCLLPSDAGPDLNLRTLADIGRMTATFAHEIRNPVASIAGALDLLADEDDPSVRSEILELAGARLRQMNTLLNDTLRMARPLDSKPETIDVLELVESSVAGLRMDPAFASVDVRLHGPVTHSSVSGHPEALGGALGNLLINAAQAQNGQGTIHVEITPADRRVVLRVRDEGPGIEPDRIERVFDPFYTTREEGTGLGLAYVRRVVAASGGTISIEPSDRGACFRIELPRSDG